VPLVWHYSARAGTWKAWEPVEEDPELMRRHRCEHHGDPLPSWRHLERQDPATFVRGMALARQVLAARQLPSTVDGDRRNDRFMAGDKMNTGSKPKPAEKPVKDHLKEAEKKFGPKPKGE
jgi:hypothetical protein